MTVASGLIDNTCAGERGGGSPGAGETETDAATAFNLSFVPAETFLKNGATMRPPGGMACVTLRC